MEPKVLRSNDVGSMSRGLQDGVMVVNSALMFDSETNENKDYLHRGGREVQVFDTVWTQFALMSLTFSTMKFAKALQSVVEETVVAGTSGDILEPMVSNRNFGFLLLKELSWAK